MRTWTSIASILAFAFFSQSLIAQENNARLTAYKLMDVSGVREAMDTSYKQTIDLQIRQNPTLAPFRRVLVEWNQQYTSYDSVKDELADLYLTYFTETELNEMIDFYSSDIGQKSVEVLPQLMMESSAIGEAAAERHLPELQHMIQVEAQRLEDM
jgi:hypothetical protein